MFMIKINFTSKKENMAKNFTLVNDKFADVFRGKSTTI